MSEGLVARSLLFVPASRPERIAKAEASGADIVTVDLEDSVAPAQKAAARAAALAWLAAPRAGRALRALRINGTRTEDGLRDLLALLAAPQAPDLLVLPKAEAAADLHQLDALLGTAGKTTRLLALIESAAALARLDAIAGATPRLFGLLLGSADLSADLRAENCWESLLLARSQLVRAAAAAGLEVLDAPCFDLTEPGSVAAEVAAVQRLGFTGKCAIHPRHVATINAAFSPAAAAVEEARLILQENAKGVAVVGGRMIDEAIARRARRVLALAERTMAGQGGGDGGR
ncbi:MAG: CoA ester lyase [Geminicoccaceae bacterium]